MGVMLVAHVDDLIIAAEEGHLNWVRAELEKRYKLKAKITGPEEKDEKETQFLGRSVRWTPHGVTWEADTKHVEKLLEQAGMTECNSVTSPLTTAVYADQRPGDRERRPPMEPSAARLHRSV